MKLPVTLLPPEQARKVVHAFELHARETERASEAAASTTTETQRRVVRPVTDLADARHRRPDGRWVLDPALVARDEFYVTTVMAEAIAESYELYGWKSRHWRKMVAAGLMPGFQRREDMTYVMRKEDVERAIMDGSILAPPVNDDLRKGRSVILLCRNGRRYCYYTSAYPERICPVIAQSKEEP